LKYSPILVGVFFVAAILNMLYIKLMSAHPNILSKGSVLLVILLQLVGVAAMFYVATRPGTETSTKNGLIAGGAI